jgi:Stress responsive A/B Barrel Domain
MAGFRHVVMFTWVEGVTTLQRRTVAERLAGLPAEIPEIRKYSFGDDLGINEGTYDFVVVADFADQDDYLVYRDNPVHRTIIQESITPIVAQRAAVQYEL